MGERKIQDAKSFLDIKRGNVDWKMITMKNSKKSSPESINETKQRNGNYED